MVLRGRKAELGELEGLLSRAESGLSGVLVLEGPAGIGKTALLEHAVTIATTVRVTRVAGVEAEQDMGFAGLHRLLLPFLGERGRLPGPQRDALETAFGMLTAAAPPDLFLVGLAALSLLADAAATRPLLAVCDDAQWLDRESLRVLGFVARRLDAEGVVLLFGVREHTTGEAALAGLPTLRLDGLAHSDAAELLDTELRTAVDGVIAARLLRETAGNPLAILELARGLGGGTPVEPGLGDHLPLDRRLETRFLQLVRRLDATGQDLLLVLAADAGDRTAFRRATRTLTGADPVAIDTALHHALRAELIIADTGTALPVFRHPLIRSAVYNGAAADRRRAAHAALAAATDPSRDAARHAWHRAAAAHAPDETVAAALESAAAGARERGGHLAQAALLRRAAELTAPGPQRDGRLLAAAGAALTAGAPRLAEQLLDRLTPDLGIAALDAYAMRLRGFMHVMLGREGAVPLLFDAATVFAATDSRAARDTLLEAFDAVIVVARIGPGVSARHIAEAALTLPPAPGAPIIADLLLDAHAELVGRDYAAAVPLMRRGLAAMLAEGAEDGDAARWFLLGVLLAIELWDIDALGACSRRYAATARRHGALRMLQAATHGLATHALLCGRLSAATAHFAEFKDVAATIGADLRFAETSDALLHGWRGDAEATLAAVAVQAGPEAETPGGLQVQLARGALVVLHLSRCDYPAARQAALTVFDEDPPHFGNTVLPDLIEAAVRCGDTATAAQALDRLARRANASGTPWALGVLARGRALLADDAEAERYYREALELLGSTPLTTEVARTRLLYGEWLRRRRRRRDARDQLHGAHELFLDMGASGFAERARTELAGTGETARERSPGSARRLTPRELQIAHLAATGITNQQIAAELFLSTATVEYHLRKVFRKLDVTSRRELPRQL
ncbi:AAA family ATPase [Nocardia otitidiscaviarum]|uniref:LuxR C-terminal-related transcriptional regulator n=1 Tax=Nocardia otitidiscaviarum TaxID=1823 RepID=UPI0004A6BC53|nr:LuxR family transcriptional regulator [Nocardia otitidiscaviarum]MBF6135187.1 AAA family ATPase [Nocardia otitidiscaviarum]MBF6487008.1 AAA family ATPase [Nocardia otitidiscaviarum]